MSPLASKIVSELTAEARQFPDIVDTHMEAPWPDFLRAWGEIRDAGILQRDEDGAFFIPE